MIIKRVWIKKRKHKGLTRLDADFTTQPFEGWYLFGIIPLYIRARSPEKHTATGREYPL